MPLVSGGQRPVFAEGTNALRTLFSAAFDPKTEVVLPPLEGSVPTDLAASAPEIRLLEAGSHRFRIGVRAPSTTILTLAQAHFSAWRAFVDDVRVPILRANHAYQAVVVAAGEHVVRVEYRDWGFIVGLVAGVVALLVSAAFWKFPRNRVGKP
jgi:hypothetical protein